MSAKLFVAAAVASVMGFATIGATCTWTGAAGDGLWSTPGNWQGNAAPVDGDSVTIPANTSATMDTGDTVRTLAGLTFTQPVGNFTLKGAGLLVGANVSIKMYGSRTTVFDCPITLIGSSRTLTIGSSTNSVLRFKKPISSETIAGTSFTGFSQDYAPGGRVYVAAPMGYKTLKIAYNNFYCEAANILSPTGTVYFTGQSWGDMHHSCYVDLCGYDQTILSTRTEESTQYPNYNTSVSWQNRARNIRSTGREATLTICGNANDSASTRLGEKLSVVFAPSASGVTHTFIKRPNTMSGSLAISNGTFVISQAATFKNVKYLAICAGATLKVDETSFNSGTNALSGLVEMYVAPGATLDLPTGTGATLPVTSTDNVHYYKTAPVGVTEWRTTSGDWSTAANWSEGVPSRTLAAKISSLGEGMHVSVASDAAPATNLSVIACTQLPAELDVSAKLPLDNGFIDIGRQAKVTVKDGGRLEDVGQMFQLSCDNANAVNRMVLHDRAEMVVENGGRVVLSNTCGTVAIGGADETPGKLTVKEGGNFEFYSGQTSTLFRVYAGGEIDVQGRLAMYRRFKSSRKQHFRMDGGSLKISGNGIMEFPNDVGTYAGNGGQYVLYFDSITATDNARFAMGKSSTWDTDVTFGPVRNNTEIRMKFSDNACFSNQWGHLVMRASSGSRAYYDFSETTRGFYSPNSDFCMDLAIGNNSGYTQFDYAGTDFAVGTFGYGVGLRTGGGYVAETNVVNLYSSVLTCNGTTSVNPGSGGYSVPLTSYYGACIGLHYKNGSELTKEQRCPISWQHLWGAEAGMNVNHGHFMIGVGRAEGHLIQHDGATKVAMTSPWGSHDKNTNQVTVVGAWGGYGEIVISNGTYTTRQRTFVGGVATNDYMWGFEINGKGTNSRHLNYHDAEGLIRVARGSFTAERELYLGMDGSGTFEIGPCGVVTGAVVNLMSSGATLKFTLDAANGYRSGESTVQKLIVADGASIAVDVGDYHGKSKTLLTFAAKEGSFQPAKITVTGANANDYAVSVRSDRIFLKANIGTVILLR